MLNIQSYGNAKSDSSVRTSISATTVVPVTPQIAANPRRVQIGLTNASSSLKFYIAFGSKIVTSTDYSFALNPGDYYETWNTVDAISVVASGTSATDFLNVTEMT